MRRLMMLTLTLAVVFVPLPFLPGDLGRLFSEFGFTLAAAVLFSALVALTLTPMMASKLPESSLKRNRIAQAVDSFFKRASQLYDRRLRSLIRRPWLVVGAVGVLIVLGGVAVAGSWLLVHTAFTFHYAHLYYREDETLGGLDFPGGEEPDDLDFAYFAFTIGMTFQTSDVEVSERGLRRTVLRHAMLSFVFNTAILALAVSLLFGRLQ